MKIILLFFFISTAVFSQKMYKGNISDEYGALPGASICVKNTQRCTSSDFYGDYQILVNPDDELIISYIGMETKTIKIKDLEERQSGLAVKPVLSDDYNEKIKKENDTIIISKPAGKIDSNEFNKLGFLEIKNIARKSDGEYVLKQRRDYDALSFEINQEFSVAAPIRLPKYQKSFAQGRSQNGQLVYQSPETNEVFSWGPDVTTLAYSNTVSEYYPQGNIVNQSAANTSPIALYNPNHFFQNKTDSKTSLMAQIENVKNDLLTLNLAYARGNIVIPDSKNYEINTSLRYLKNISKKSKIEMLLKYNTFYNNLSNANFGVNKIVFANAVTPVHFDNQLNASLASGLQRSFSNTENNPYYLIDQNIDSNKSSTIDFYFKHDYSHRSNSNIVDFTFQSSQIKGENGQHPYFAGIDLPNFDIRNEKFNTFLFSDRFTYDFNGGYVESKTSLGFKKRDLERNYFSNYNAVENYPLQSENSDQFKSVQDRFEAASGLNAAYTIQDILGNYERLMLRGSGNLTYSSTVNNSLLGNALFSAQLQNLFNTNLSFSATQNFIQAEPSLQNNNLNFNTLNYALGDFKKSRNNLELITPKNAVPTNELLTHFILDYSIYSWNFTLNYYFKKTDNLYVPLLNSGTFSWSPEVNYKERGVELEIRKYLYYGTNFRYGFSFNFASYRNEVTSIHNGQSRISFAGFSDINKNYVVGQPLGVIMGSSYLRDASNNLVIDTDGFPIKNSNPKILGNPNPDFVLGFNNTFNYKDFTLNVSFDYNNGGEIWNGTQQTLNYYGKSAFTEQQRSISNYVFEGVTQTGAPNTKAVSFYDVNLPAEQNRWVRYGTEGVAEDAIEKADYLRLSSLSLQYKIRNNNYAALDFSITFFVDNVFVWAKSKSAFSNNTMLSSVETSGLDYFNTPMMRSFGSRLTLKF
ncbi:carboxypeptidase-like regulatory domain-containing protein [Flavobacterium hungaricum]|uniref:TonB-dependent receptor n=1 Tax=Flavobacterium hungaricum TaxID=2082725 RepID=A0ABR9TGK7_9FLAO|nr:carboxypeptidase-like regulatory domain-containing protein [Flavobacterium hungaricum]MBE8723787.1 hypothetical protein [Flavobacterium hungaricum]